MVMSHGAEGGIVATHLVRLTDEQKAQNKTVDLTAAAREHTGEIRELEKASGVRLSECYQCGKCSAGCPMFHAMDLAPRQVIRYLQLGLYEEVLHARTPWVCATCQTCLARCPHNIDLPALMEAVRQESKARGIIGDKDINRFNELFLNNIDYFGRSHEMVLAGLYNLTTGHLLQDVKTAPKMYFNKLIRITPHIVWNQGQVRRILKRTRKRGDNK